MVHDDNARYLFSYKYFDIIQHTTDHTDNSMTYVLKIKMNSLTCNCVNILLDPVICWFNFKKCPINRFSSLRFMPSIKDAGTKRSKPNSRLRFSMDHTKKKTKEKWMN